MPFYKTISFAVLCLSFSSGASIFKCKSPTDTPQFDPVTIEVQIKTEVVEPYFYTEASNKSAYSNRKPFLFYYVIDSAEPYMQLAVNYELEKLKSSCLDSEDVNFAFVRNSQYVSSKNFYICKNKNFATISITDYPVFWQKLQIKEAFLGTGDHTTNTLGPMNHLVHYKEITNAAFAKFPLAHPDFLLDFLRLILDQPEFFPSSEYMPFLNLKSHGSQRTVLSGLYECQIKAKTLSQEKFLSEHFSKEELEIIYSANNSDRETLLDRLLLGNKGGDYSMRADRGMSSTAGLGILNGLGETSGLGANFVFGTYNISLNGVFDTLIREGHDKLGFMMLEACDTNREAELNLYNDQVLGFYSAKKSLWYRNLNWWTFLAEAKGDSFKLNQILDRETRQILNFEVKE